MLTLLNVLLILGGIYYWSYVIIRQKHREARKQGSAWCPFRESGECFFFWIMSPFFLICYGTYHGMSWASTKMFND